LTLSVAVCQSRARAKSVGRLNRKELHLTLFPHGKTANVQGSLAQPTDESNCSANFVLEEFWGTSGAQILDKSDERKQTMKTTTSFTYPAFALFVLACFALSPQAFGTGEPTFTPNSYSGCNHSVNVTFRSTTSGGLIWVQDFSTGAGFWISNGGNTTISFATGSKRLKGKHANTAHIFDSGWGYSGTYAYVCGIKKVVFWVTGGILLVAALIWLFRKWSSSSR